MDTADIKLPSDRSFGSFFSVVFLVLGAFLYVSDLKIFSAIAFSSSLIFLTLALFKPKCLNRLNSLWMKLGFFMGMIVSPLILGGIFFLFFSPLGVILRLFGRDELHLKLKHRQSYWKIKQDVDTQESSFKNQF